MSAFTRAEDVGVPVDRIDTVALGGSDERKMHCDGFGALVGAREETIFPDKNPAFNRSLTFIIVDCNVWIFEKSGQCSPVIQRVINCLHQFMSRVKIAFGSHDHFSQQFDQRLRLSSPHGQSVGCRFIFYFSLDLVQISVYVENDVACAAVGKLSFKIFSPGVSAASSFNSLSICKQRIKSASGIKLYDAVKIREEVQIFFEGQIRRVIEHDHFVIGIADVSCDFAFSNIVFVFAVLNFNRGIISLYDARLEKFALQKIVQQGKHVCSGLNPIALCRARYGYVIASKNLLLTVVWKTIFKFANDDFTKKARASVATWNWRTGFFSGDNVQLALRAGTSFLFVVKNFQTSADHFELLSAKVANEFSFDSASWTDDLFWFDGVMNWLVRELLCVVQNVLGASRFCVLRIVTRAFWLWLGGCWARVVFFGLFSVFSFVALFGLCDQVIEFYLKTFQQCAKLGISIEGELQLALQIFNQRREALNLDLRFEIFPFEIV